jgi:hypothetical protein
VLMEEQLAKAAELDEVKHPAVAAGPGSLLNFRGLYAGLYRTISRHVHAQNETVR